jgi:hypothetical protein
LNKTGIEEAQKLLEAWLADRVFDEPPIER